MRLLHILIACVLVIWIYSLLYSGRQVNEIVYRCITLTPAIIYFSVIIKKQIFLDLFICFIAPIYLLVFFKPLLDFKLGYSFGKGLFTAGYMCLLLGYWLLNIQEGLVVANLYIVELTTFCFFLILFNVTAFYSLIKKSQPIYISRISFTH